MNNILGIDKYKILFTFPIRKDEEAKAENGNDKFEGGESSRPLMIQDDANPYDRPNAHTNTRHPYNVNLSSSGGHTASPYMVSGLNLPEGERSETQDFPIFCVT